MTLCLAVKSQPSLFQTWTGRRRGVTISCRGMILTSLSRSENNWGSTELFIKRACPCSTLTCSVLKGYLRDTDTHICNINNIKIVMRNTILLHNVLEWGFQCLKETLEGQLSFSCFDFSVLSSGHHSCIFITSLKNISTSPEVYSQIKWNKMNSFFFLTPTQHYGLVQSLTCKQSHTQLAVTKNVIVHSKKISELLYTTDAANKSLNNIFLTYK